MAETNEVTTFTYEDFISGFPKPGQSIGSASSWTLAKAEIVSVADASPSWVSISGTKFGSASGGLIQITPERIQFLLSVAYDFSQQREELLDISMPVGLQEVPEDDDEREPVQGIQLAALNLDASTREWEYEDPDTLERNHFVVGDERLANGKAWTAAKAHNATKDFTVRDAVTGNVFERVARNARRCLIAPAPAGSTPFAAFAPIVTASAVCSASCSSVASVQRPHSRCRGRPGGRSRA
ncbi:hypothetical protein [Rhizobium sp. Leaf383]|uniref:hypothetical protein n=1 Tax=Rhizobium sp. Leaf383 TaxID=1736357 RepID=UPI0012E33DED|nr:hypothetical protein [Rhizobium sp. Leaf383]